MIMPVVAGLVVNQGRLLISQVDKPMYAGTVWEFPGGKMEPGESPEQALSRELFEELGIKVRVGHVYDVARHVYERASLDVLLLFYWVEIASGEVQRLDGQKQLQWITQDQLDDFSFAPADARLISRLKAEGWQQPSK